ncbi:MAG: 2,3-bisphosphoglycerate-independent phosphoglycerate mutase [Chloroflexota bacterium]|nr:MAG: 2,3-bisphosphoglycerate-independent phosphoglycerate mutase [Chloroflexota bacterium]
MISQEIIRELAVEASTKIVMLVMDGLGGLPKPDTGLTELETARTPNLDRLAYEGSVGFHTPVGRGITPGSGPGHLSLFGYDPVRWQIGRGVLEALGIDFDLQPADVAARGNFCTVDANGVITDRRAGRIATDKMEKIVQRLQENIPEIDGVQIFVRPVREHRFVLVLRGSGLSPELTDTDPQREGVQVPPVEPQSPAAHQAARVANEFVARARALMKDQPQANMLMLRGFASHPHPPSVTEVYKLKAAAIAVYPMYRGLARLVGMDVVPTGSTIVDEFSTLAQLYHQYDFFFIHYKRTDSTGEDGNFDAKVAAIEELDRALPDLTALKPDVLVVTGDHSTPAMLKAHSWHPVPALIHSRWCRADRVQKFGESSCRAGSLGILGPTELMTLALANAERLTKFGA